jgi:hypothetical protein
MNLLAGVEATAARANVVKGVCMIGLAIWYYLVNA